MLLETLDKNWEEYAAYVDTLILPFAKNVVTQQNVDGQSYLWMTRLARAVEKKLTGRVLLLPTIYWMSNLDYVAQFTSFFRYCLCITDGCCKVQGDRVFTYTVTDISEDVYSVAQEVYEYLISLWEPN